MTDGLRQMRATDAELDRVDDLLTIAYGTASRRLEIELYLAAQPDGWFVIEEDGELVAVGGGLAYGPFCWIGLVGTHPRARGRGLATAISRHLVEWSRAKGCATVALDASDVGRPVYERIGFELTGWTIELSSGASTDGPLAERASAAELDEIVRLDGAVFGGDRSTLLRRLAAGYADAPFITRGRDERIDGYLFARERLIGPGLAANAEAAAALVRSALTVPGQRRLLVPAETAWLEVLGTLGLVEQRRLAHMRLGRLELPGAREQLVAQLSFATG